MISFRILSVALLALLTLSSPALRAHDPYDITSQARLLPEGIELRLTLASSTARRLLTGKGGPIESGQFAALRAEFERRAPQFLIVSAGNKALVPIRVVVELTEDEDVKIFLQYPASNAARFHFEAALLKQLPQEGYTVFLLARGPRDDQAVAERMTLEKPACDLPAFSR